MLWRFVRNSRLPYSEISGYFLQILLVNKDMTTLFADPPMQG
jgi:hypothetical protein